MAYQGYWRSEQAGGLTVVQNPKDAAFSELPENAIRRDNPDHVVHLREMPALLDALVRQPAGDPVAAPDKLRYEVEIARNGRSSMDKMDWLGRRSVLTCPDCGGIMWEIKDGDLSRYRCHIGHAYTQDTIAAGVDERLKRGLATALRALNERVALLNKMRDEAGEKGRPNLVEWWSTQAHEFEREVDVIRDAIGRLERAERHETAQGVDID
jgi:two-component system, chemotaxis family, protein-glutamate methylesterase/glutaminase